MASQDCTSDIEVETVTRKDVEDAVRRDFNMGLEEFERLAQKRDLPSWKARRVWRVLRGMGIVPADQNGKAR